MSRCHTQGLVAPNRVMKRLTRRVRPTRPTAPNRGLMSPKIVFRDKSPQRQASKIQHPTSSIQHQITHHPTQRARCGQNLQGYGQNPRGYGQNSAPDFPSLPGTNSRVFPSAREPRADGRAEFCPRQDGRQALVRLGMPGGMTTTKTPWRAKRFLGKLFCLRDSLILGAFPDPTAPARRPPLVHPQAKS
jgi:hypothetical protein